MVEMLAEQGYDAATVRTLAQRAKVSTRAFYECYPGKEECFLSVHELTARRLLLEIASSQVGVAGTEGQVQLGVNALLSELDGDVSTARLMLVDVHAAGPKARAQAQQAQRSIEMKVSDSFNGSIAGDAMHQFIAEGVVAGAIGTMRARILSDEREPSLPELSVGLSRWALAYPHPLLVKLEGLSFDRSRPLASSSSHPMGRKASAPYDGDAGLLLSAAAKLVAAGDPEALSTRNVLEAAGLPRRAFNRNFASLEDCVVTALEVRAREAIATAKRASGNRPTPVRRIVCAVATFCREVAQDPGLAGLCFGPLAIDSTQKMLCQERIRAHVSSLIEDAVEPSDATRKLDRDASVAACWGVLHNEVVAHGAAAIPKLAPALSYLILAPAIGATGAIDAIRGEYGFQENNQGGAPNYE